MDQYLPHDVQCIYDICHRRRSSVNIRGHDIFARKICMKNQQNAGILHDSCPKNSQNTLIFIIFARKINKIPEFYMIFARKFFPQFQGAPRLLRL